MSTPASVSAGDLQYVGFWPRVGATLIDSILLVLVTTPLLWFAYGPRYWSSTAFIRGPADFFISWVLPAVATVAFWSWRRATPGKMAISARIVDATTGNSPSMGQWLARYLGYFASIIPVGLGMIWVAFDDRKQGWHDKLAHTVVVRPKVQPVQPVVFASRRAGR
jgi:uncharacterized RDD family membrane protein YckC